MRTIIIAVSTLVLSFFPCREIRAQAYSHKFGEIGSKDLELVRYQPDTSASAVVIYETGKTTFIDGDNGFDLMFEKQGRIKIFSKPGFRYAEIRIPFYRENKNSEEVLELEAYTYNEVKGTINRTKLDPGTVYEEKAADHWYVKKFAMPDVREGSIIEYRYKLYSPFLFNLQGWSFQSGIPTIYSGYDVYLVPFYDYTYVLKNAVKFDESDKYQRDMIQRSYGNVKFKETVCHFVMKNVPALMEEPFMTCEDDNLIRVNFQLSRVTDVDGISINVVGTWDKLIKELLSDKDFGKYMAAARKLCAGILQGKDFKAQPPAERLKSVVDWVKSSFNWNTMDGKYAEKTASELLDRKSGNDAEINLFLAAMLNEVGLEAYPLLISTRDHGKPGTDYPFLHSFNYVAVLVIVDGKPVLTDGTSLNCPDDRLPPRCLNGPGLIINKEKVEWVPTESNSVSLTQAEFLVKFTPVADSLYVTLTLNMNGYEAYTFKEQHGQTEEKVREFLEGDPTLSPSGVMIRNAKDAQKPLIILTQLSGSLPSTSDALYIHPFLSQPWQENPFRQENRKYPIDFTYLKEQKFHSVIMIPDGYKVSSLPDPVAVNNDWVSITYQAKSDGATVEVTGSYRIKKVSVPAGAYLFLKHDFSTLVDKMNQKVLLERK
jgi:hypothetical protein